MKKLLRAWGLFAVAALASCQGDADKTQTSSKDQAAAAVAKPLMLTTDSTGLVPKTTAKATTVVLDGRFESAVVARRNADGTISTSTPPSVSRLPGVTARTVVPGNPAWRAGTPGGDDTRTVLALRTRVIIGFDW